jgi:predicted nucleotidyltransferase
MVQKLDFITPTLIQVLDLFMADPLQDHHEREVMRMAGVSKGSANRILHELSESGLLTVQKKGRMVFYKLNLKNPSARQFKILSNVYSLKELIEGLQRYSRRIILFGSCAQGTDVKESDVDLMVLTDQKNAVKKEINRFNSKEKKKVAPIVVDANELAKMKREDGALYENIERGILLWETEDNERQV